MTVGVILVCEDFNQFFFLSSLLVFLKGENCKKCCTCTNIACFAFQTGESDYANLPFQQRQLQQHHPPSSEQGPHLADGHFVRELLAGLPWDIYEDKSKRKFFHNRETGELTWKPPRKDKPTSPVTAGPTATPSTQIPVSEQEYAFVAESVWYFLFALCLMSHTHRLVFVWFVCFSVFLVLSLFRKEKKRGFTNK